MDEKQTADWLKNCDCAEILTHRSPDGDTLGSAFALCAALRAMGKRANVICPDPIPAKYGYLTDGCPKEDFVPQCVISADVADVQLLGSLRETYEGRVDLAIDHHASHRLFAARLLLEGTAAATCQPVARVIDLLGVQFTPYIANCIYTGLSTDTGCFRYPNTQPETHRLAARMMECGCDAAKINRVMFEEKSRARVELEKLLLSDLRYEANGKIAVMCLAQDEMRRTGASDSDLDGFASQIRQIEGVQVGVFLKETAKDTWKASVRTGEEVDASALCEKFGGGGHARAAGCTLAMSRREAVEALLAAAEPMLG